MIVASADWPTTGVTGVTANSLESLNAAKPADFVAALANIFEHSPWIAEAVAPKRPFATLEALRDALVATLMNASSEQQLALIRAHPDLANKTQRAAGLTAESTSEQDGAGLDRLSPAEFEVFERSNSAYKTRFDIPFIVSVRRHTKDSILDAFARRLKNSAKQETEQATAEICRIATLRLAQLLDGAEQLGVHGRLSTHVLDTRVGKPAAGVSIELIELSRLGESRTITRTTTNQDGRTDKPLIYGRPLPMGTYELRFDVSSYFDEQKAPQSDPPYLSIIPLRFGIADPEGHLHVPLLVTPWSYATYRGS